MDDIVITPKTSESSGSVGVDNPVPVQLQSFFHIENPSKEEMQQLETVWDFFDGKTEVEKLYQVKQLENRLGTPNIGETRFSKVYEYVKLTRQIRDMEKLRDAI